MIIDVAVPFRVNNTFHYDAPPELAEKIGVGSVIRVPFRNRPTHAFVVGIPEASPVDPSRIRSVDAIIGTESFFDAPMLRFLKWVAEYYSHPLGEVLSTAIPRHSWERTQKPCVRPKRPISSVESILNHIPDLLTQEQQTAIDAILNVDDARPFLLHGVTGSGKTEIYIRCLQSYLNRGFGAIVLVPEISLTPQLIARFSARFPGSIAVWHSHLTPRERREEWDRVRKGEARIVIGARSAVFAPITQLGCIVVDEEHESSYKQEDELRYHARDVAIVRATQLGAKVILGSATPSVESYYNASSGKFAYGVLSKRVQDRPLPNITIIDLKKFENTVDQIPWLSRPLDGALQETLAAGKQAILYLNRLGFSNMLYCAECGYSWRCNNCDIGLTYYRHPRALRCHYCGLKRKVPDCCPECRGTSIDTYGFGTEQVEKTLQSRYPAARVVRMDRSAITTKKSLESLIERIARRDVDIIVGTQMIAKGHDFPGITLVGILIADASLNIPDFRAYERTYQILTQVSGRAGRADDAGQVVIQTLQPEHSLIQMVSGQSTGDFYDNELQLRRKHRFPPFSRLALVRFQHKNAMRVSTFAQDCARQLIADLTTQNIQCSLLGPSEAPIARLKNYYRWQCLLKSASVAELKRALGCIQNYCQNQKTTVQVAFDIDPMNGM